LDCVLIAEPALTNPEVQAICALLPAHVKIHVLADNLFCTLSMLKSHNAVLALWAQPVVKTTMQGDILLLDAIQDPGNVGSILRTAVAAGISTVYLSAACADAWSPKVLRAGMGAHFAVDIVPQADLVAVCQAFQGEILMTHLGASESLYMADLQHSCAWIVGNEGAGVGDALAACATQTLRIPMRAGVESLNVGAATAICLFEMQRSRAVVV
jgi:TrmH family RNA methyltransferase